MARTAISVAIGLAFVIAVIWYAIEATNKVECEVCVDYRGRYACSTSLAADLESAAYQAHNSACSQITGGVTETLECDRASSSKQVCTQ
jgi:hypothetical protein